MRIKGTFLFNTSKTWLLKTLAVLWFTPIYSGAVMAAAWLFVRLDRQLGLWLIGSTFQQIIMYTSIFYYFSVLTYLAATRRTWVPNRFVRYSVQYLFKLPKQLKKLPVLLFSGFSGFVYFFLNIVPVIERFQHFLPPAPAEQQALMTMTIAIAISLTLAMATTRYLLKHVPFVKLHCMHELTHAQKNK